jgi:excinuclease ABC subunit C
MAIRELKDQIASLPEQPGVYLYLNAAGDTIYVGKARVLRDRVRSYLGAYGADPKTDALLDDVARLDVIVTDSVVEALALENNLIKQRSPKYNILLRDDKSYPYLQLTTGERFPRVLVARRVERDGGFYAGPFLPASFARRTIVLTHRLFGLRSCNEVITGRRGRPCLEYDIKRCLAPCVDTICSAEEYGRAVGLAQLFLEGRSEELVTTLDARMADAAAAERFEEAAAWRDAIRAVQAIHDRQQKMATTALGHRDVFGLKRGPEGALVQIFQVRAGRVVERIELGTGAPIAGASDAEVVDAALQQFYELRTAPPEVHVPVDPDTLDALEAWLSERAGHRVRILAPQRGGKRELVDLANRNAALAYQARFAQAAVRTETLASLQAVIGLPALPRRIECFDISTMQGRETVASMVVCVDGRMERSEYRKFKIRRESTRRQGEPAPDDFAAMREVVGRHGRGLIEQGGPFPDLVIVDGGRGQVSAAYDALETLGLANLVVLGIAKREEQMHLRDRPEPIALDPGDPALLLVQRIRDEAHRFAVTYHRRSRTRRDLSSDLDEVPGIGPRRRRALLTRFGSLAGVRRATREELVGAVGAKVADAVLAFFAGRP